MSRKGIALATLGSVLIVALLARWWTPAVASYAEVRAAWRPSYAFLLDRHGAVLAARRIDFDAMRLPWVPLADVSPAMQETLLAIEDRRFRKHGGVDWLALGGAVRDTVLGNGRRGGSTITMQLAASLHPESTGRPGARNVLAKWSQMRLAWALEADWTKDQILESWLNRVSFRGDLQGIGAATAVLLDKEPKGLTASESLVLATLVSSPAASGNRIAQRVCHVAQVHRPALACPELKGVTMAMLQRAARPPAMPSLAPHLARELLDQPGERVVTTLDARLQQQVKELLARQLLGLSRENVRDGAAVILDNRTGDVLAYVGSAGPDSTAAAVDGVAALRQAGSTLKPFLYGIAFEKRYLTPASVLDDSPLNLDTGTGLYIPQNYDRNFKGPVSAHTALASSLNIPAVRTLVLVGVEPFRDRLVDLGYRGITGEGDYYGYSLALGSAEVTLLQQANAYRALANGGQYSATRFEPGEAPVARRVLSEEAAFLIGETLSDPAARSVTFGLGSPLATPFWSAVKTGTSKDLRDNWCIGYSQRYTVAVWVGNFEGDSMLNVSGVTGAAPAWTAIMQALHAAEPSNAPEPPPGVRMADIEYVPAIEPRRRAWFVAGTETARIELLGEEALAPRIVQPANGTLIALDPDIPERNQRVIIERRGAGRDQLFLDGKPLGEGALHQWAPVPGTHHIELRSSAGEIRDRVLFTVR